MAVIESNTGVENSIEILKADMIVTRGNAREQRYRRKEYRNSTIDARQAPM